MSDVNVSSTTAAEPTSQPAAQPAASTQAAAQPATQATTQAPATGAAPTDDRSGWVPPYRIRETRDAVTRELNSRYESEKSTLQTELEQLRSQVRALVGVQPSNANPEVDAIRNQFANIYPGLATLEQKAQQLEALLERAGDIDTQNSHYWTSYGRQTMDRLFDHASKSMGSALTDEGKRALHSSFVGFVQQSPEMVERYTNDPSIVEDFWKDFTSSFIDPVRRTASAGVQTRGAVSAALPQDTPGGAPRPATGAPKLNGLDERAAAAWSQYQTITKQG